MGDLARDGFGPGACVLIAEEGHGGYLVGSVALDAVVIEDRGDVGGVGGAFVLRLCGGAEYECGSN